MNTIMRNLMALLLVANILRAEIEVVEAATESKVTEEAPKEAKVDEVREMMVGQNVLVVETFTSDDIFLQKKVELVKGTAGRIAWVEKGEKGGLGCLGDFCMVQFEGHSDAKTVFSVNYAKIPKPVPFTVVVYEGSVTQTSDKYTITRCENQVAMKQIYDDVDMYTSVVVYSEQGEETEEYLRYGHSSKEEFKTQYNKFETARLAKLEQEAAEKAALEQEEKDAEEAGLSLEAFRAEKKAELFEQLTGAFERHSEEFDTDELRAYIDNVTGKKAEAANVAAAAEE